ncbi:protein phosphatase 2C domain-containing protein [Streptomyces sp. NPDC051954]|uniref:protein phosphatase 2C domain-containing protein n=1 Tax=Streptomyces sp. NPDC051954 TaxID=3155524 RepID=UPI00342228A5
MQGDEHPHAASSDEDLPDAEPALDKASGARAPAPPERWAGKGFAIGDPGSHRDILPRLTVPSRPEIGPQRFAALVSPGWRRPDTVFDGARCGALTVRAASTRGDSHRHEGIPRQDDYCLLADAGWLIAAVADGVSQGELSHLAADAAAAGGCRSLLRQLHAGTAEQVDWERVLRDSAKAVVQAVHQSIAQETGETTPLALDQVAKLASTAVVFTAVPMKADAEGIRRCILLQVGDVSAWALSVGDGWVPLTEIKSTRAGEAVSGATSALPLLGRDVWFQSAPELRQGDVLMLMTDGVGDALGDGTGEVGQVLGSVWTRPPDPHLFAAQVDFQRMTYTDDRTVVGIWSS